MSAAEPPRRRVIALQAPTASAEALAIILAELRGAAGCAVLALEVDAPAQAWRARLEHARTQTDTPAAAQFVFVAACSESPRVEDSCADESWLAFESTLFKPEEPAWSATWETARVTLCHRHESPHHLRTRVREQLALLRARSTRAGPIAFEYEEAAPDDRPWIVLVAGEHWMSRTGQRTLGLHCSLPHLGVAYSLLVESYGRDRVIVLAQLGAAEAWLVEAQSSGLPLFSPALSPEASGARWGAVLSELRRDCARLIDDGGPDYEGEDVNPATLVDVLCGRRECGSRRRPVVPRRGGRSVVLAVYSVSMGSSHGSRHVTHVTSRTLRHARHVMSRTHARTSRHVPPSPSSTVGSILRTNHRRRRS